MNIFQKVKNWFVKPNTREKLYPKKFESKPQPVVAYEQKAFTKRQWSRIKHKRRISAKSRMRNLLNA